MKLRELFTRRTSAPAPLSPAEAFLQRLRDDLVESPLNLPCFPDIVPRVRKALDDPNSTADDIVRIAGTEPRLAARLLQTANSVVFNPGGKASPNLRSAVTRLGHNLVQSVAMVFAIQQMKADATLRPVAGPLAALWEKSVAVASICQVLANHLKVPPDKVFLTGLLHGIGHFYILVRVAEPASPITWDQLPADLVTTVHPAFGRAVLEKWGFETIVCETVARQNEHGRTSERAADITDVLIASVVLAEAQLEHGGDLSRIASVDAFRRLRLGEPQLQAVLRHTEHSLSTLRETLAA